MHADDIRRVAAWLAATDIGVLELRGPGTALRLRQRGAEVAVDEIEAESAPSLIVNAASVGVFLHRHPLRTDDLAPPGSAVVAGQVLGLLQTGPLLLPVTAPADALVQELLVAHGTAVGYGTPLAALLPSHPN
jgi:acetyl-CoA carboxylase biotin carboxyl carrier protein